jgi:hypothetical protein
MAETPSSSAHYFFPDGTVVLSVRHGGHSDALHFLRNYSSIFDSMFSLPAAPGELPQGESEESPIVLEVLECSEFDCFLSILYPSYATPLQRLLQRR